MKRIGLDPYVPVLNFNVISEKEDVFTKFKTTELKRTFRITHNLGKFTDFLYLGEEINIKFENLFKDYFKDFSNDKFSISIKMIQSTHPFMLPHLKAKIIKYQQFLID